MTAHGRLFQGAPAHFRGVSTVDRALKVVGDILDEGGEAALRLADVSQRSGVSVGSLYHHFGSREGLVNAARERQFLESLPIQIRDEAAYLEASSTPSEFIERFDELLCTSETAERAIGRRRRFEMIGAAAGRPGHLRGIVSLQSEYLDIFEHVARTLEERGWLHDGVTPRAVALYLHAVSMARVLRELDEHPVANEAWRRIVEVTLDCLVSVDTGSKRVHQRAS